MTANPIPSTYLFEVFAFLQLLDFLTTLTGLKGGAQEINPFVRQMMSIGVLEGLLICKFGILLAGLLVMWYRRERVILVTNYAFAGLVVWNVTQLMKLAA